MEIPAPERRRRRPAVSCILCRRKKIRCNQEKPCSNCMRSQHATCVYLPSSSSSSSSARKGRSTSAATSPATAASVAVSADAPCSVSTSAAHADELQDKVWRLEAQLAHVRREKDQEQEAPTQRFDTTTSRLGGSFHFHRDAPSTAISRSVTHKARSFGQSHWMNTISLFRDVIETIEPHLHQKSSPICSILQQSKSLARLIKVQRTPPWPSPPTLKLPTKTVADELVGCYMRTIETIYRILHIPTFMKDYEALWQSDTQSHSPFLVQLKLVLAIGATMYDDTFSMRSTAIQWIYEAQTWVSNPESKSRLTLHALQIDVLLLIAREIADVGGETIWVSAGALYRRAVHMGLHRDPDFVPQRTAFPAEMRRRLWNTILELSLQASITSGGPPFVSFDDFDVDPPGNFDDDQLAAENPKARLEGDFTETSIAIALRKTFPARLAVAKFLNDVGSHGTYEQTLSIDRDLRATYKLMCRSLQACAADASTSTFGANCLDIILHRYLSALHAPYFGPTLRDAAYAYSRKVVVESSLKIWRIPHACTTTLQHSNTSAPLCKEYLRRLTVCGSGFFRTVTFQAVLLISVELRMQLQEEEESLSSVLLRPDLTAVIVDARLWSLQVLQAGETNIKGNLLICVLASQLDVLRVGLHKDQIPSALILEAEDAAKTSFQILEDLATDGRAQGSPDLGAMSFEYPPDQSEDWQFLASDTMFDSWNADSLSWMLKD